MGQPRASRRRAVHVSSDEDDPNSAPSVASVAANPPMDSSTRKAGKLKPVKTSSKAQHRTPTSSAQATSTKSPKPSKSRTKSESQPAEETKRTSKPIFSFFNAATQRQRNSQPSASPEKAPSQHIEELDVIDGSEDDDRSSVAFSKGSSTALALRKRKAQQSQHREDDESLPLPATQKFRKTSDGGRAPCFSVANDDKRPWNEQFAPQDLSELAVHKRKVADVRQWIDSTLRGRRQKILILKGAAGSGKTTTVQLLAKAMRLQILEWRNPAGSDLGSEGNSSAASLFEDFVARAGKAGGLSFSVDEASHHDHPATSGLDSVESISNDQMLLIEEFPNTFSRTSQILQSFRSALSQYLACPPLNGKPIPIVIVLSETLLSTSTATADSFTAHRLLGPDLLAHPFVDVIEFNAVAPTILAKALDAVVLKEARKSGRRKTPNVQILKTIAECGDIRSAVSSLEFICLRGDSGDTWSAKVAFTKPKKARSEPPLTKAEEDVMKLISNRENTLGIFHSVGKVVYNKRVDATTGTVVPQPPAHFPQHIRLKLPENDVDQLMNELGTDASTFIAALHENHPLSCASSTAATALDSLCGCIDNISDADLLSLDRFSAANRAFSGSATDSMRQDEMAYQVAARGLLFCLPSPVRRAMPPSGKAADAHRMFYPMSARIWRQREEIEGLLDLLTTRVQSGTLGSGIGAASARPRGKPEGVESWTANNMDHRDTAQGPAAASESLDATHVWTAKNEMLVDRLPFMANILESKGLPAGGKSTVTDQVLSVVRIRGQGAVQEDNSLDDDAAGEDGQAATNEQWATDRQDDENTHGKKKPFKGKQKLNTEGGGLHIPVESQVEKLVLEEDDIVDD